MPVRFRGGGGGSGGGGSATVVWGPSFGEDGDLVEQQSVAMPEVKLSGGVTMAAAPAMPTVKVAGGVTHAAAPALPTVKLAGGVSLAGNPSVQHTTSAILAPKDSWCDIIAACPVDANRDGTDLQVEGITATKKDIIMGWDLSGFPTGATVTSAILDMWLTTPPVGTQQNLAWTLIAQANEGWSESTVRCSNIPANTEDAVDLADLGTTAGARTWALNSAARTRIGLRMGVGSFSLRSRTGLSLVNCVFESADQGTNNSLGPRLTITFTVPA